MLQGRDSARRLIDPVTVINKDVRLFYTPFLGVTFSRLFISQRLYLKALDIRVVRLALESFKAKVVNQISSRRAWIIDPSPCAP
jgi:hypothetical protein